MACQRTKKKKKKKKKMQLRRRKCREKWKSICLKRNTPCVLWKWVEKMIIFSIFKFVFTFPNFSYNFLIFSNRMNIFPSDFFIIFSRSNRNQLYFLTPLSGSIHKWKLTGLEKHTERTCTHTHTYFWKSFFILHTNCLCM